MDVLKVEVPEGATPETVWRVTRLSRTRYYLPQKPERRNLGDRGKIPYVRQVEPDRLEPDSDVRALVDGVVSVTPLSLDITSRVDMGTLTDLFGRRVPPGADQAPPPCPTGTECLPRLRRAGAAQTCDEFFQIKAAGGQTRFDRPRPG